MVAAVGLRLAALLCVLWVQSATAGWGKGGKGNWGSKDWHGGRWGHGKHQWQGQVNSQSGIETGLAIAQFLDEKKRRKSRRRDSSSDSSSAGSSPQHRRKDRKKQPAKGKVNQELEELRAFRDAAMKEKAEAEQAKKLMELEQKLGAELLAVATPQAVKPDSARAISQVKLSGLQKKLAQKVLTDHVDESAFESWDVLSRAVQDCESRVLGTILKDESLATPRSHKDRASAVLHHLQDVLEIEN